MGVPYVACCCLLPILAAKQHQLMTLDGFMMYLLSPEGDALDPAHTCVFQDMDQPLAHYFISSSHNTYLTDSQIGGPSSTEAYVRYCEHFREPILGGRRWGSTPTVGFLRLTWPSLCHPHDTLACVCLQSLRPGMPLCGAGLLGGARRGTHHLPRPHTHLQDPLPRCGPGRARPCLHGEPP